MPSHLEPANEQARLLIIEKYKLPAAFQEPIFHALTTLAADIFGLPVAFLSLVDHTRVDFPATHGVPNLHTLPREAALCSLAVQQHATVVLNDISVGSDSPQWQTAQRFGMEFYVGAPILLEQQYAVGALCLSDSQSRAFGSPEEHLLYELAAVVSQAISARWHHLAEEDGAPRWQAAQQLALEDVRMLKELLRHLAAQRPEEGATPRALFQVVRRRLTHLQELFVVAPAAGCAPS